MKLTTRLSAQARIEQFLHSWREAPSGADIEIRIGESTTGIPAVLVSIGADHHAFTADEADVVASAVEGSLRKFGKHAIAEGLDNMILGLRSGAQAARRALAEQEGRDDE